MSVPAKGKPDGVVCRELVRMVWPTRPRGMGLETAFVGRERELFRWSSSSSSAVASDGPVVCRSWASPGSARRVWSASSGAASGRGGLLSRPLRLVRPRRTYSPLVGSSAPSLGWAKATRPRPSARGSPVARSSASHSVSMSAETSTRAALQSVSARSGLRLLSELALRQTVVLVVEDLHWASEPLRELLERLLADVEGSLLLFVTARPDRPELRGSGKSSTLGPLTVDEADQVLHRLLASELDDAARDFLVQRADGNPFFLEELFRR